MGSKIKEMLWMAAAVAIGVTLGVSAVNWAKSKLGGIVPGASA